MVRYRNNFTTFVKAHSLLRTHPRGVPYTLQALGGPS